jgi:hypothetical protein
VIRAITEADRPALVALLQATDQIPRAYGADGLDGWWLVEEAQGRLRGAVRWEWGRPECWVHVLTVAPAWQATGRVGLGLLRAVAGMARTYGAVGLAGFARADRPAADLYWRGGATLEPGYRVRVDLRRPSILTRDLHA